MRSGRIAETANVIGEDYGNKTRIGIAKKAHRIADPVTAVKGASGPPVLVNQNSNSVFVGQLYRDARGIGIFRIVIVGINGIWREFADADRISPQEISGFLDVS